MRVAIYQFFKSIFWPIPNVIETILLDGKTDAEPEFKAMPIMDFKGHALAFGASFRNTLLAVACIYGLYNGEDYPGFRRAKEWSISWMWPIVVRNLVATWLICGLWDWWLYFGPLKDKLFKYKIVQKYPPLAQFLNDAYYTTLSSFIAACMEIALCHGWATGAIPMVRNLSNKPFLHLVLAMTIPHWRISHFQIVHRAIHPWRLENVPDVGKYLYRKVHSVHHKSTNITTFTGTCMHPVESTLYYSAALLVLPLVVHPCIFLGAIFDLALTAWIGHGGYVNPGTGDFMHSLHHLHFDCNYGTRHLPLDYIFGTFAANSEDFKALCNRRSSEKEAALKTSNG